MVVHEDNFEYICHGFNRKSLLNCSLGVQRFPLKGHSNHDDYYTNPWFEVKVNPFKNFHCYIKRYSTVNTYITGID